MKRKLNRLRKDVNKSIEKSMFLLHELASKQYGISSIVQILVINRRDVCAIKRQSTYRFRKSINIKRSNNQKRTFLQHFSPMCTFKEIEKINACVKTSN